MYKILKTVIKLISNFLPNSLKNHKQSGKLQTNTTRVEVDAIDRNRPTDLLNQKRNSFGLKYPNNSRVLGTKGDVETFFLVLNDLVSSKVIEDRFQTISHDLYKTLINYRNIDDFIIETLELKDTFSMIEANSIDWTKYPYNRQIGKFDYQQMAIDVNKHKLLDVFHKFFNAFEDAPFWVKKYIEQDMVDFPRVIVSPTELGSGRKFKDYTDEDFIASENKPLWLRETD